jgi:hypothetical protein
MDSRHGNFNQIDLDLHRLTDIQLYPIYQSHPGHVAVSPEWVRRLSGHPYYMAPKAMDSHLTTLNGIDFNLLQPSDIQLDTVHRSYPNHLAVNSEWECQHPSSSAPTYSTLENEETVPRVTHSKQRHQALESLKP